MYKRKKPTKCKNAIKMLNEKDTILSLSSVFALLVSSGVHPRA